MGTNSTPQALFGPGVLIAQRNDIPNQTPYNIGYVNEFSFGMKFSIKELYGTYNLPLVVAAGTAKVSGKIKAATESGQTLNGLLLGQTLTLGTQYDIVNSPATAIPATPFQITPTIPNTGTWVNDLGVVNAANGQPFQLVATGPAAGQYSVASGVYTFSAADHTAGISVVISAVYSYTTNATGMSMTVASQPIGSTTSFQLTYKSSLFGSTFLIQLFRCVCGGADLGFKLEDFAMPEFDYSAFTNSASPPQLGIFSWATQA